MAAGAIPNSLGGKAAVVFGYEGLAAVVQDPVRFETFGFVRQDPAVRRAC